MMFTNPTEFSFETMDELSAKKALSILAAYCYLQKGGPKWLNQNISQFGCTADGLINEVLIDHDLTKHSIGQALHHQYRLHVNPNDDEDEEYPGWRAVATYLDPTHPIRGGKSLQAFEKPTLGTYTKVLPETLMEKAIEIYGDVYAEPDEEPAEGGLFNGKSAEEQPAEGQFFTKHPAAALFFNEQPAEEQFLEEEATELEVPEQEASVADYDSAEEEVSEKVTTYEDYESESEELTSDVSDEDNSDDEDYVEKAAPKFDELPFDQQLERAMKLSREEALAAQKPYNGEASGYNGRPPTPPATQAKTASSPTHSTSGKQLLTSANTTPALSRSPSSDPFSRKRGHSDDDSDDDDDDDKPARPAKKHKSAATSSHARKTPASGSSSSARKAPASGSSSSARKAPASGPSSSRKSRKSRKSSGTSSNSSDKARREPWTDKETHLLWVLLRERRDFEAAHPEETRLYDSPLWDHISDRLFEVYGYDRQSGGCKSNWNRCGRARYGFEERSKLKRSSALATSVQVSKKDKKVKKDKGKQPAVDDYDDDDDADKKGKKDKGKQPAVDDDDE
ncbi:hypothetical protein NHQ30_005549 [Ciborinia camelliae]|nr:hypothetical protein NHQ30_005549 [Ciborinia camelliae]